MFMIRDIHTKVLASRRAYKTRRAAQRAADKLNLQYGAHRYVVCDINGNTFFASF